MELERIAYLSTLARIWVVARNSRAIQGLLEQVPFAQRLMRRVSARVRSRFTRARTRVWVRVKDGIAKGLWLYLSPVDEDKYWFGVHEPALQQAVRELVSGRRVRVVYDVGAHIGFFALATARIIGVEGRVIAFEPDIDNVDRLRQHAARNGLTDRVEIVPAAVWCPSDSPEVRFKRGSRRSHGGVCARNAPPLADAEVITVPTVTLDGLAEQGYPVPEVVKLDVEGGECEVLEGGERLFSQSGPVVLCEIHRVESARWAQTWLEAKGYTCRWLTIENVFPRLLLATRSRTNS